MSPDNWAQYFDHVEREVRHAYEVGNRILAKQSAVQGCDDNDEEEDYLAYLADLDEDESDVEDVPVEENLPDLMEGHPVPDLADANDHQNGAARHDARHDATDSHGSANGDSANGDATDAHCSANGDGIPGNVERPNAQAADRLVCHLCGALCKVKYRE